MNWPSKIPLIAILRGITPEEVTDHAAVLLEQGFDAIEIPLNSPRWQESVAILVEKFSASALIGAGTVLNAQQVEVVAKLGAKLIVTPNTQPEVIRRAVSLNMIVCAGCATATEAFSAIDAGAQALKIFPAGIYGPGFIRALKSVLPTEMPVFAVGGVKPENLADFLSAGCSGAGLGSDLYQANQSVKQTAQKAKLFMSAYQGMIK